MIPLLLLLQQPAFLSELKPAWVVRGQSASVRSLTDAMSEHHISSFSVSVFERGKVTFSQTFGGDQKKNQFQFGSLSKVVAAVTALRMVDQGKLKLDDPIDKHLGDWSLPTSPFTVKERVTLRRLLGHTAGLAVGGFPGYEVGATMPTLNQMLDGISPANSPGMSFEYEPGSQWKYSGGGYLVLQKLLESVTRKPYSQLSQDEVLGPAGMSMSGFTASDELVPPSNPLGEPISRHIYPELTAAGLVSTTDEYAHFLMAIPSLLKDSTMSAFLRKGLGDWGLGVRIRSNTFSHSGRNFGYDSLFFATADCQNGFVAVINSNNDTGFLDEVADAIFAKTGWPGRPEFVVREAYAVSPETLDSYAGHYETKNGGQLEVRRDRFRLFATVPGASWVPLTPNSLTQFEGPGCVATFSGSSTCELRLGRRTLLYTRLPLGR